MSMPCEIESRLQWAADELAQIPSVADAVTRRLEKGICENHSRETRRRTRRVFAVMFAAAVLGGVWLALPAADSRGPWWLAPPAAIAEQVRAAVDVALAGNVSAKEELIVNRPAGVATVVGSEGYFYANADGAYRRDIYANGKLREIQWYVPAEDSLVQTSVRFDSRTVWHVCRHPRGGEKSNLVERIRRLCDYIAQADRKLGTRKVDGVECVGFVIDHRRFSDGAGDPGQATIWFDVATKLPVRTEYRMAPQGDRGETALILSEFSWLALPANTFVPHIPAGAENENVR